MTMFRGGILLNAVGTGDFGNAVYIVFLILL